MRYIFMFFLASNLLGYSLASANEIPNAFVKEAKLAGVAPEIVYTLALTESGITRNGLYRPWPWTLTYNKKGYFYNNKAEMKLAAQEFHKNWKPGIQFGIGIMQVEWRYHSDKFQSLENALDPYENLRVGIAVYKNCLKNNKGNQYKAIGCYHSNTQKYADKYLKRFSSNLVNYSIGLGS